jgi:hypothetical protein
VVLVVLVEVLPILQQDLFQLQAEQQHLLQYKVIMVVQWLDHMVLHFLVLVVEEQVVQVVMPALVFGVKVELVSAHLLLDHNTQ